MVLKDRLVDRWEWLRVRMPPGEPYGRNARMLVAMRVARGYFFVAFGLVLMLAR